MARDEKRSVFTGYVIPCLMNPIYHPTGLAIPIMRGPERAHVRCQCGFRAYLPPDWRDDMGLTPEQAAAKGLLVLTQVTRSFAKTKERKQ